MSNNQICFNKNKQSRNYLRISFEARKQLIRLVEQEKFSIKRASQEVSVNYSTAKLIMKKFKSKGNVTMFSYEKNKIPSQESNNSIEGLDPKVSNLIQERLQSQPNQSDYLTTWYWIPSYNWIFQQNNFQEFEFNQPLSSVHNFEEPKFYCWNF